MAGIKVRVHCADHFTHTDLLALLPADCFLVQEVGDEGRAHYQGLIYMEPTTQLLKNLRNTITRKLKLTGNRAYSVAEAPTPEGYVQYLCKGADETNQPIVLSNPKGVDTKAGHEAYWAEHARLLVENPKGYKRRSVWSLLQECTTPNMSAVDIGLKALELYEKANKVANPNALRNMAFTIRARDKQRARYMVADIMKGL